jgi:erythromycin esterase-like protein
MLIGLDTVAAANERDEPRRIKNVVRSCVDSYERVFLRTGVAHLDLRTEKNREVHEMLSAPCSERAIGAIHRPETEFHSHDFEAVRSDQFDACVWAGKTQAVTPLPMGRPHGVPETYPFGI